MLKPILVAAVSFASPACAMTAAELLPSCEAIPDIPLGKPMTLSGEQLPCWWYLVALHDLMGVADVPEYTVLGVCPRAATFTKTARLFVAYVKTHPKVRNETAALGGLLALREAYCCTSNAK